MKQETPPLFRTQYPVVDGKIVETQTPDLFVWATVDTKTGNVDITDVQPFDDELDELRPGYEWRRFRLVPE
jgi:hypothetical protein